VVFLVINYPDYLGKPWRKLIENIRKYKKIFYRYYAKKLRAKEKKLKVEPN